MSRVAVTAVTAVSAVLFVIVLGTSPVNAQDTDDRLEDTVVGPDGQETVRFHGIFVGIPHIVRGQVVQESLTRIRLRLVTEPAFSSAERQTILARFRERLGEVDIEFELVDEIERSERGKFRAVISRVDRSNLP